MRLGLSARRTNRHQGILNLSESDDDGLLVLSEYLPGLRLHSSLFVPQSLGVEQRTGQTETVPRHTEVPDNLARKICRGLSVPEIGKSP